MENKLLNEARIWGLTGAIIILINVIAGIVWESLGLPTPALGYRIEFENGHWVTYYSRNWQLLPATLITFSVGFLFPSVLIYFAMRNITKVTGNYKISSYCGASILTFFLPVVPFILIAKSLKWAGQSLANSTFIKAGNIFIIAGFLSLISISFGFKMHGVPHIDVTFCELAVMLSLIYLILGLYRLHSPTYETA